MKVSEFGQSQRLEIVNGSKPYSATGIGHTTRPGQPRLSVRWVLSPHPSPLPWGEGEPTSVRRIIQTVGFSLRDARCSLSLRDRVRVRGNAVADHPAYLTIPGTDELGESPGRGPRRRGDGVRGAPRLVFLCFRLFRIRASFVIRHSSFGFVKA